MDFVRRFAAMLLTCLCFVPVGAAHPAGPYAQYTVAVQDENGRELPTFHQGGRTFVLGTYGDRYTIRVENRSGQRVEAVVSVDGRDVISGQVGDYVSQRGYLIDPYGRLVIEGFRQNYQEVAAFRFTHPGNSYSSRMGTPQNVGVIGVAIFPERSYEYAAPRRRAASPRSYDRGSRYDGLGTGSAERKSDASGRSRSAPSAPSASSADDALSGLMEREASPAAEPAPRESTENLGTEYGESVASAVREVEFRRASPSHPAALITLRYDDRAGLIARGIALDPPRRPRPCGPQAFPNNGFAPPPPPYCD
jgi:hypothetical protein